MSVSLSQSSTLPNVCDLEELFFHSDAETFIPDSEIEPQLLSSYDLRPRRVTKFQEKKTPPKTQKSRNPKRQKKEKNSENDTETVLCSQESVSLLQECYTITHETNEENDNDLDVTRSPQRETIPENLEFPAALDVEKDNDNIARSKFISSVVHLKFMLSSKNKTVSDDLHDVIESVKSVFGESIGDVEAYTREEYRIPELPDSGSFSDAAQTLLVQLENILEKNLLEVAGVWKNSVYELAVDLLNEAVHCDLQMQKSVEVFLFKLVKSILNDAERSKNLVLESKAILALTLSKSTGLCFSLICYIIGQMKGLKRKSPCVSLADKLSWSNFVKSLYVLLRVLEASLDSVKSKLQNKRIDEVLNEGETVKNINVFELWMTRWGGEETARKTNPTNPWKRVISNWFNELDEALVYCVNHFPISAMAVDRCRFLVMEILRIC